MFRKSKTLKLLLVLCMVYTWIATPLEVFADEIVKNNDIVNTEDTGNNSLNNAVSTADDNLNGVATTDDGNMDNVVNDAALTNDGNIDDADNGVTTTDDSNMDNVINDAALTNDGNIDDVVNGVTTTDDNSLNDVVQNGDSGIEGIAPTTYSLGIPDDNDISNDLTTQDDEEKNNPVMRGNISGGNGAVEDDTSEFTIDINNVSMIEKNRYNLLRYGGEFNVTYVVSGGTDVSYELSDSEGNILVSAFGVDLTGMIDTSGITSYGTYTLKFTIDGTSHDDITLCYTVSDYFDLSYANDVDSIDKLIDEYNALYDTFSDEDKVALDNEHWLRNAYLKRTRLIFSNNGYIIVGHDSVGSDTLKGAFDEENATKVEVFKNEMETLFGDNADVIISGDIIKSGMTLKISYDVNNYFEYTLALKGDINGDGLINYSDIKYYYENLSNLTPGQWFVMNVNDDERVDDEDISRIAYWIQKGSFDDIPLGSEIMVNASLISSIKPGMKLAKGDEFDVSVRLSDLNDEVNFIRGMISFNSDLLELVIDRDSNKEFTVSDKFGKVDEDLFVSYENGEFIIVSTKPLAEDTDIITFRFKVRKNTDTDVSMDDITVMNSIDNIKVNPEFSSISVDVKNNHGYLNSLGSTVGHIKFDKDTTDYVMSVPYTTAQVSFYGMLAEDAWSNDLVTYKLTGDRTTVEISIVAGDGVVKTYRVTIVKEYPSVPVVVTTGTAVMEPNVRTSATVATRRNVNTYSDSSSDDVVISDDTTDDEETKEKVKKDDKKVVDSDDSEDDDSEESQSGSEKVIIIVLIVLVIIGLLYLIFKKDDDGNTTDMKR